MLRFLVPAVILYYLVPWLAGVAYDYWTYEPPEFPWKDD